MILLRDITTPSILDFRGFSAFLAEFFFILFAVISPVLLHSFHLPVFVILPMHWSVLMAGMIYGWRAGVIAGVFSPLLSFFLTGMPLPQVLPLIVVELTLYGFVPGMIREKTSMNSFFAVFIGLIAGRAGFVFTGVIFGKVSVSLWNFVSINFSAGLPAAFLQLFLIPFFVSGFIFLKTRDSNNNL